MKNIILIISLMVFSYNAIGADKYSPHGLEGWGKAEWMAENDQVGPRRLCNSITLVLDNWR